MLVLAIDTALAACSAAVLDTGSGTVLGRESLPMARGQVELLVPMIGRVMKQVGTSFGKLDRIAVSVGPGSFTGLRVGIAAARGIALAASKPAVGVSTLAAFAAPHIAEDDMTAVAAAVDARHGQVYLQLIEPGGDAGPPRIAAVSDAIRAAAAWPTRLVGNATELLITAWPDGTPPPVKVDARAAPDIDWVARLGAAADVQEPPRPLYLRAPDAKPQEAARLVRR